MNEASSRSHIRYDDLLQAAIIGLIIAIDGWNPEKGALATLAHFIIPRSIRDEIISQHWNAVRPPYTTYEKFLKRQMTPEESDHYVGVFMCADVLTETNCPSYTDEDEIVANEILEAAERADLTLAEHTVFRHIYHPETPFATHSSVAKELGMTKNQIRDYEEAALDKIRLVMGVDV